MIGFLNIRRMKKRFATAGDVILEPGSPRPAIKNEGGEIHVENIVLHPGTRLWVNKGGVLTIGEGSCLHRGVEVIAWKNVRIGRNCTIGWDVLIMDTDLHPIGDRPMKNKPVVIGDNACIGCRSIILKGVTIGEGAIVAAGSIVTKDVAPNTVVGGEPAKVVAQIKAKAAV